MNIKQVVLKKKKKKKGTLVAQSVYIREQGLLWKISPRAVKANKGIIPLQFYFIFYNPFGLLFLYNIFIPLQRQSYQTFGRFVHM